jgi:hypothetical protein
MHVPANNPIRILKTPWDASDNASETASVNRERAASTETPSLRWVCVRVHPKDNVEGRVVPRKGVSKLLNGPRGRRMLRDRDMHHAPAIMGKEYQDKQQPARRGRHDEEVSRNQLLGMVGQERSPGLRGEWSAANHVFGDGSLERR